jgi:hypothetical protein
MRAAARAAASQDEPHFGARDLRSRLASEKARDHGGEPGGKGTDRNHAQAEASSASSTGDIGPWGMGRRNENGRGSTPRP